MRADALNFHIDPVRTEMTWFQHISISTFLIWTGANQTLSKQMKNYRNYVLRKRIDQKALLSMKVVRRRTNQKDFTKLSTKIMGSEDEKLLVTYNPVSNDTSYFNLFECG